MNATKLFKEAYILLEAGRTYYNEMTITHLLLYFDPRFLELDEWWVDALIEAECNVTDIFG